MFKKVSGPVLVWRPVTIHVPRDGDNEFSKFRVKLQFSIEDKSVIEERQKAYDPDDPATTEWIFTAIKDWKDYMESDGTTPVPFNDEEVKTFLDKYYVRTAVLQEYWAAANGGLGRRK